MKQVLKANANTDHESAEEWYGNYGAHISTDAYGDVTHDAIDFEWLEEGDDDEVKEKLLEEMPDLTDDEADDLVALARRIKDAAEGVVAHLESAVEAYEAGDLDAVIEALDAASSEESVHGDDPASKALRAALVEDMYLAEDIALEARLSDAANEEGTIQAHEMLRIAPPSRPELHTTMSISAAFTAITGKAYDVDYFC